MALNQALISSGVTQYGTPLFSLVNAIGTFRANDEGITVIDDSTFLFDGYYVRIRSKILEDGFTTASDREWNMGEFESTREFEFNGTTYDAGRRVLFAY